MTELEQQLLTSEIGNAEARLRVRTNSYIDAGRWWRRTPLWLCLFSDELVVLAVARRRYIQRVPLSECSASHYCHATGELVIAPTESLTFNRLSMSPIQALDALRLIGVRDGSDQSSGSRLNTIAEVISEKEVISDQSSVESNQSSDVSKPTEESVISEQSSVISQDEEEPVPATGPVAVEDEATNESAPQVADAADDAANEVAQLLASEEFTDAFTEEELAEFRKMTPTELLAMLEEDDDEDYDEDEEEEEVQ